MRSWSTARLAILVAMASATTSIHTPTARSQEAAQPPAATARVTSLRAQLDRLLTTRANELEGSRFGVVVLDLTTGETLYEREADSKFNTASNTKIVTTAAALALLGPEFRYTTGLYAEKVDNAGKVLGDLFVQSRGDPSFGTADLLHMVSSLRRKGITSIRGGIVIDNTYFDTVNLPPHFDEQPDETAAYRAPIGATSLNFNSVLIEIRPARTGEGPAIVEIDPPNKYVSVTGEIKTVARGRTRLRIKTKVTRRSMTFELSGQIRREVKVRRFRRRIPDPVRYFGTALQAALKREGISLGRQRIVTDRVPTRARPLVTHESPPLAVLVRGLGKYSNNYVAETILKTIGAEIKADGAPATWEHGLSAVRDYLESTVGFEPGSYRYENGSGLFDSNEFTPRQMVKMLEAAHRDYRYGPDFVASLSIAGVDGTLSNRMADGPAARQVRAKTGTLATVSALAGYAAVDGRSPLAFAVFANDFKKGDARTARAAQDDIAEALVTFLENAE